MGRGDGMIGVELAGKLKEARLAWEPKEGDWLLLWQPGIGMEEGFYYENARLREVDCENEHKVTEKDVWLPSLSDMLAELESRGYYWEMYCRTTLDGDGYEIQIMRLEEWNENGSSGNKSADTPEDAAAEVLLWVLERDEANAKA